ncbi:hypothetical protein PHET_07475 [Paragonimus heterotremus]|uniref:Uncharacterized protein n=1 Tax=Paragonimus heterotremus TaxID=100268 RepID=A0A8J4WDR3_9TREM|nr:hypothetical protein PHET_07475 [Paragonimus heterotremus]
MYELLSNATEYFGKDSPFGLASLFHRLNDCTNCVLLLHSLSSKSATNRATQMGCDYGYNNRTAVPTIIVQCFYDYP